MSTAAAHSKVAFVPGSLSRNSAGRCLLWEIEARIRKRLAAVESAWIDTGLLPHFSSDRADAPVPLGVEVSSRALAAADAVVVAAPSYNGYMPGSLKNAFDWWSVPYEAGCLKGKSVHVVTYGRGAGKGAETQASLAAILDSLGARCAPPPWPAVRTPRELRGQLTEEAGTACMDVSEEVCRRIGS